MDRSIGVSTPFSTYRGKQMHHTLRYGRKEKLTIYTYGHMTEEEGKTSRYMLERNAINYGFREFEFHYLENLKQFGSRYFLCHHFHIPRRNFQRMAETKIGNGIDENTCSGKRQGATFQTHTNHLLIGMRRTVTQGFTL